LSSVSLGLLATPVAAQPADPATAQNSRADTGGIEEIVVTARRVEENLQDTPLSVSAFTAAALERAQVSGTENLDDLTPNLQIASVAPLSGNNSAAQVFIRGIGQTDATSVVDPGVGLYIDDVYMGSAVGGILDFRDIASVQVLRGPQGTLFGRNTIGGAILISTTEPGEHFGGLARFTYGTDNLVEGFGAVDLPLSETLRSRWSFGLRKRDGYVHRPFDGADLGDDNSYTLQGKLKWTPTDRFTATMTGDYTRENENGSPLVFAAINETATFPRVVSFRAGCPGMASIGTTVPMIDDPRCANDFWNDGPFTANGTFPLKSTLNNWGASLRAEYEASDLLTFKSITAYRELHWTGNRDADNTPFPILHTEYRSRGHQFSQEVQSIVTADRLTGVIGLFYFKSRTDDYLRVTLSPPPSPPGGTFDRNDNIVTDENYAAFSQWTYELTDAFSVTGGIRYTWEKKRIKPFQFNEGNPAVFYVPNIFFSRTFKATTFSASAQYRLSDALMTYANFSQGFKSGGFNGRFNGVVASGRPPEFDPEKADSYEIGAKLDISSAARINLAAFQTKYKDLQFTYRVGTAPFLFNAGRATIQGIEADFQFVPVRNLIIEGGFGILDDSIDSVSTIVGATTAVTTDSALPYTPSFQGNAAISYTAEIGSHFELTPRVEVIHTAHQFFDAGNTVEIAQNDDVTRLNIGLTLENVDDGWTLRAGVQNVTDEVYPIAGNSSLTTGSGYAEIAYNRGREAQVSFTKRF